MTSTTTFIKTTTIHNNVYRKAPINKKVAGERNRTFDPFDTSPNSQGKKKKTLEIIDTYMKYVYNC